MSITVRVEPHNGEINLFVQTEEKWMDEHGQWFRHDQETQVPLTLGQHDHIVIQANPVLNLQAGSGDDEFFSVLEEAFSKFQEREGEYKGLWKIYGWFDSIFHVRHKAARLFRMVEQGESEWESNDYDNALDLINYTVFAILNARAGRRNHG